MSHSQFHSIVAYARPSAPGRGDRAVRRLSRGAAMSLGGGGWKQARGVHRPWRWWGGRGESARVAAPLPACRLVTRNV